VNPAWSVPCSTCGAPIGAPCRGEALHGSRFLDGRGAIGAPLEASAGIRVADLTREEREAVGRIVAVIDRVLPRWAVEAVSESGLDNAIAAELRRAVNWERDFGSIGDGS